MLQFDDTVPAARGADHDRSNKMQRAFLANLITTTLITPTISHADPDTHVPSTTHTQPDLRMPPGTRTAAQGHLVSGRGLRDTSDFFAKELARRGIAADQIGPYGVRGVELTRFLSQTPSTPWLAIHVLRTGGK